MSLNDFIAFYFGLNLLLHGYLYVTNISGYRTKFYLMPTVLLCGCLMFPIALIFGDRE